MKSRWRLVCSLRTISGFLRFFLFSSHRIHAFHNVRQISTQINRMNIVCCNSRSSNCINWHRHGVNTQSQIRIFIFISVVNLVHSRIFKNKLNAIVNYYGALDCVFEAFREANTRTYQRQFTKCLEIWLRMIRLWSVPMILAHWAAHKHKTVTFNTRNVVTNSSQRFERIKKNEHEVGTKISR